MEEEEEFDELDTTEDDFDRMFEESEPADLEVDRVSWLTKRPDPDSYTVQFAQTSIVGSSASPSRTYVQWSGKSELTGGVVSPS